MVSFGSGLFVLLLYYIYASALDAQLSGLKKEPQTLMATSHATGTRMPRAFTLIELLIVVAIIAILAAIAVPNFLEAQTRSKVSRAKADMRTLATGLTCYFTDNNQKFPPDIDYYKGGMTTPNPILDKYWLTRNTLPLITTPVAYLTSVDYREPFTPEANTDVPFLGDQSLISFMYFDQSNNPYSWGAHNMDPLPWLRGHRKRDSCIITSKGPDGKNNSSEWSFLMDLWPQNIDSLYDPTNGTVSGGDIVRGVGGLEGVLSNL
jgi:prepilin-type N-terminal cleavage/methylation domain-containing protein